MIWIIYILLDALLNWYLIEKKKVKPFYLILFILRGIIAIIYGAFILDVQPDIWSTIKWFLGVTLPFPFIFNTTLNFLRKKPIVYFGKESGWIDSFVVRHKLQNIYFYLTLIAFAIGLNFIK